MVTLKFLSLECLPLRYFGDKKKSLNLTCFRVAFFNVLFLYSFLEQKSNEYSKISGTLLFNKAKNCNIKMYRKKLGITREGENLILLTRNGIFCSMWFKLWQLTDIFWIRTAQINSVLSLRISISVTCPVSNIRN